MIPISDDNPTLHTPWMTYAILAAMFATWILVQGAGLNEITLAKSVCNLGMVPAELMHTRPIGFAVPIGDGLACRVDNESINRMHGNDERVGVDALRRSAELMYAVFDRFRV